jgi:polyphosphate kinase
MFLDDVIRYNLPSLFPGYEVGGAYAVKLSRDAELYIDEEFSGDIVDAIRKGLKKRETGPPSRFLYDLQASYALVAYLKEVFRLQDEDLVIGGRYHNLHDLRDFPRFALEDLFYPPWPPLPYGELDAAPLVFDAIRERDRLLHFPYHSYDYVVRFLTEAAADPDVEEIWLTVYRVSRESAVLHALLEAAEQGKKVRVFVEVQARFDEAANLRWAERLEKAGVITMYSIPGIKVHAKLALVARREEGERRLYTYLSTGNFNESTARFYSDFGLLTADPRLTRDVQEVLRYLAGEVEEPTFSHLLVAPFTFRDSCYRFIDEEMAAAAEGRPSGIALKMNALEDEEIVGKLYAASAAGVPIQLVVRGICCLIPGLEGLSETVKARSIVDRFLEHARIYSFHNGGDERLYLASGDWMYRNLSQRVEVAFPLYDPEIRKQVRAILDLHLADNMRARLLDARQSNPYVRDGGTPVRAQEATRRMIASSYVTSILSGTGGRAWSRRPRGGSGSGAPAAGGPDAQPGRGRS